MIDRHVRTKQCAPSTKEVIARIKEAMQSEPEDSAGRKYFERMLKYWEKQRGKDERDSF